MAKTSKPMASPAPQPPYIKRAHLRNVPPLRDVKVDFKPGLNIIIGKNGSGKTNFMKLLSELADLQAEKYRGEKCEIVIEVADKDLKVEFDEQLIGQNENKQYFLFRLSNGAAPLLATGIVGKETRESTILSEAAIGLLSENFYYSTIAVWHGIPAHRLPIVDEGADLLFNNSGGMRLTKIHNNSWQQGGVLERALIDSMVPYDVGGPANHFASLELDAVRLLITRGMGIHIDRLNDYLPIYSPIQAVRIGEQFQVYRNTAKDEIIVKGLVLEYFIENDWLPFSALSDGTKRIFYIIGELMTASMNFFTQAEAAPTLSDFNKIIFLEEPELGIHPDQLQLLLQLIREVSNEHQVIMTTHSPQTLDMLSAQELDRITICEFIPGKGTQMRKLSAAKKNKAKAYLRDKGFLSEFWRFSDLEKPD